MQKKFQKLALKSYWQSSRATFQRCKPIAKLLRSYGSWFWLGAILAVSAYSQSATQRAHYWVDHTFQVLEEIQVVQNALLEGQQDFLIYKTDNTSQSLRGYRKHFEETRTSVAKLRALTKDNSEQQVSLEKLEQLLQRNSQYPDSSFSDLQPTIVALQLQEEKLLDPRREWAQVQQIFSMVGLMLGVGATVVAQISAQKASNRLNAKLRVMESEKTLSSYLLTCRTLPEAHELLESFLFYLLPDCRGAIYTINNSRAQMVPAVIFGDFKAVAQASPKECWALRRGEAQASNQTTFRLPCQLCKAQHGDSQSMLCLPLQAHEETIGIFHLLDVPLAKHEDAKAFAHQIALPLAVLKLQTALEDLGFYDALTGLHNRRFLDESLPMALALAQRSKSLIAFVLLDVDNFKRWNDTHGHLAGDAVLNRIAQEIKSNVRPSDFTGRWGGEELVIAFLGLDPTAVELDPSLLDSHLEAGALEALQEKKLFELVLARVEVLREIIANIQLVHNGQVLSGLTASFGVAIYRPTDTKTAQALFDTADSALRIAKLQGKNQVVLAK